jgi:hypothetical protein
MLHTSEPNLPFRLMALVPLTAGGAFWGIRRFPITIRPAAL